MYLVIVRHTQWRARRKKIHTDRIVYVTIKGVDIIVYQSFVNPMVSFRVAVSSAKQNKQTNNNKNSNGRCVSFSFLFFTFSTIMILSFVIVRINKYYTIVKKKWIIATSPCEVTE